MRGRFEKTEKTLGQQRKADVSPWGRGNEYRFVQFEKSMLLFILHFLGTSRFFVVIEKSLLQTITC